MDTMTTGAKESHVFHAHMLLGTVCPEECHAGKDLQTRMKLSPVQAARMGYVLYHNLL